MSGRDEYWRRKIQALFWPRPPDYALAPEGAAERGLDYLRTLGLNDPPPDHLTEAHEIAFGLDVPAFVRQLSLPGGDWTLTHPLAGTSEPFPWPRDEHIPQVFEETLRAFEPWAADPQKLFLALWRFLPEATGCRVRDATLRASWGLLPADPRLPDHSAWEHAALAAAVAGTWDPDRGGHRPALLLGTIGSVQEFLLTARRTQDLWMGSYLLSYLLWRGLQVVADRCGPDCIIYPDLWGQPLVDLWLADALGAASAPPTGERFQTPAIREQVKIASFPNAFTALVPEDQAEALATEVARAISAAWEEIAREVAERVEPAIQPGPGGWDPALWAQAGDLVRRLGLFWLVYPLDRAPDRPAVEEKVAAALDEFRKLLGRGQPRGGQSPPACFDLFLQASQKAQTVNLGVTYSPVSQLAARLLTARKALRDFPQQWSPGERCSLCGTRSALHPPGAGDSHGLRSYWEALRQVETEVMAGGQRQKVKLAGRIRRGDRLCAVCLIRRLAWEHYFLPRLEERLGALPGAHLLFPSTATIATAAFKRAVLNGARESTPLRKAVKEYVQQLRDFPYYSAPVPALERLAPPDLQAFIHIDGEWLFDESFDPEAVAREYPDEADRLRPRLQAAREAARRLRETAAEALGVRPARYYAVVAMDGDHMGEWLSGQRAPVFADLLHLETRQALRNTAPEIDTLLECRRPLGLAHHRALTVAQRNFALEVVRRVVEEAHAGKLIYAGGDDVLALLPLRDLLPVLRALRWLCSGERAETGVEGLTEARNGFVTRVEAGQARRMLLLGPAFTASAGVAIVHHTHPFAQAVEEAYRALKTDAKEALGRNAFALRLLKRSGDPVRAGARWRSTAAPARADEKASGSQGAPVPEDTLLLLEKVVAHMADGRLSGRLVYDLARAAAGLAGVGREAQAQELARLVQRHINARRVPQEERQPLVDAIQTLLQHLRGDRQGTPGEEGRTWQRLVNLLLAARFLAEEG